MPPDRTSQDTHTESCRNPLDMRLGKPMPWCPNCFAL